MLVFHKVFLYLIVLYYCRSYIGFCRAVPIDPSSYISVPAGSYACLSICLSLYVISDVGNY